MTTRRPERLPGLASHFNAIYCAVTSSWLCSRCYPYSSPFLSSRYIQALLDSTDFIGLLLSVVSRRAGFTGFRPPVSPRRARPCSSTLGAHLWLLELGEICRMAGFILKHRCHGARSARFSRVLGAPSAPSAARFRSRAPEQPSRRHLVPPYHH